MELALCFIAAVNSVCGVLGIYLFSRHVERTQQVGGTPRDMAELAQQQANEKHKSFLETETLKRQAMLQRMAQNGYQQPPSKHMSNPLDDA